MNVQAHVSGQISGQVSNQGVVPQQNGNFVQPPQMQNLSGGVGFGASPSHNVLSMDHDLNASRQSMRKQILDLLLVRHPMAGDVSQRPKYVDIVKRLEEGLFKMAVTKEEYMNPATLESRLGNLLKNRSTHIYNQRRQELINSSSTVGTMIPTPGMSHNVNSSFMNTSAVATSAITVPPAASNTGSLLPARGLHNVSFSRSEGMSSGFQHSSASYSVSSGGNMSSMGGQRIASQMIPTPGFNNSNNTNSNSQSYNNLESSNHSGSSGFDSTMVPQPPQQRQQVGGQNSRILHNLGSQMGSGLRSGMQQKSYGITNGSLNSGLGTVNESRTSDGYPNATPYANTPKHVQQSSEHLPRPVLHGDGYGMNNLDSFGSGNFYGTLTSAGLMTNTETLNSASLQSMTKSSSSMVSNQSNLFGTQQAAHMKHHSTDQIENFQSPLPSIDNLLQSPHHQQHQFQQQPHQLQKQQCQQKQQSQQHKQLLNNDAYGQTQRPSDLGSQVKCEPGVEHQNEVLNSQASEQIKLSELQNHFQQNSAEDHSTAAHHHSVSGGQHDNIALNHHNFQQMQPVLQPHQLVSDPNNDFNILSVGSQSESVLQGQWIPQSQGKGQVPGNMLREQHIQQDFHQRISGQDDAQRNNLSSEGSVSGQVVASTTQSEPQNLSVGTCRSGNENHDKQFRNQQRWLLFLFHARRCKAPEGKCPEPNCITVQKLWRHMNKCNLTRCKFPRCHHTKILFHHHKHCRESTCPVCFPVRNYLRQQMARKSDSGLPNSISGFHKSSDSGETSTRIIARAPSVAETSEGLQPSLKRIKLDHSSSSANPVIESSAFIEPLASLDIQQQDYKHHDTCMPIKSEFLEVKREVSHSSVRASSHISEVKDNIHDLSQHKLESETDKYNEPMSLPKQEGFKLETENEPSKQDTLSEPAENMSATKSGKPKIKGVSLTELFTPEQIRAHITGLRQWVGQSKAKVEKNQAMEHLMSENSCQLCAVEKLTFEPPPTYCTPCGARIKRNAMYYTMGAGDTRHYFCNPCYNEARGDAILVDGTTVPKGRLEKKKNDEETEEWWVQCDKCEAWQHQICALFNGRRNDGGQAEYTCPNCYIAEIEQGERNPLPQSAVLGAKDLPKTILSDHIEQRLFRKLKHEREERARVQGKSYDEVPGAEALVVRVVSSVDKKLEVKQRFLEIFREENYPIEFPYKSKVVLLFQKIEGVEVCLFGMYVQEFGTESQFPNQRRVYLSYLDSVKYFRPEVRAVSGEALRTFVYHEILIGYLEYCKKRGFTSCYIWACPPLKGEDYILYCHPEIQKTPKSDKLREWYLAMLRKASKEKIVVELTNLYDHFFVQTGESRAKVTAARLPYFDGDYWPGAAEDLIYQINQEEDNRKQNKKGTTKKTITKRALKASGQYDLSGNASKDLLLMHKLGETISPMKEDFIMVHLQHCCTHCCTLIVDGNCWTCNQCKNFQLCDRCYEIEQKREERERHPVNHREKHTLYPVSITDVSMDTKDKDEILESEFFDTRQAFLSLCQGNHYQYDTLRRAKHSSMMVLYHLHNPTAPAFVTTCNMCHLDIETGQGWRCEICPDYDVCNACYQKDGGIDHPHKLTHHPSIAERDAQNKEARQLRVVQLRKMLDLLVHASQCRSPHCQYPNCRKVKGLFRHGIQCRTRASGGCVLCKKMWYLLQLHARACKESECHVPRCKDLKEHLRRLQQQADSRRRAAVMEMMRQRAAEVAGNSG